MVRRGGVMLRLGPAGIFLVLVAAGAVPAFGIVQNCNESQVQKYTFNLATRQNVYTAYRSCYKYWQNDSQSSETFMVISTGTWDATAGRATEVTDIHHKYYSDGVIGNDQHYAKTTSADCPSDPWQNQVDCTNNWLIPPEPLFWFSYPPYPLTAQGISAAKRSYLKNKFAAAQRQAAPEIVLPKPNGKYANGQLVFEARVRVPDEDEPNTWTIELETNMDQTQPSPHNIPIKASKHVAGPGTAWFYLDLPYNGFWFARARSTSPKHASDWSGQVRFEIAGSKGPQFLIKADLLKTNLVPIGNAGTLGEPPSMPPTVKSPTQGQVVTGALKILVVLPPGSGTSQVKLEFECKQGGAWQKFTVLNGYDTKTYPSGYTLNKSKFQKMGAWRVRARAAKPNASWCNPVEFEVK